MQKKSLSFLSYSITLLMIASLSLILSCKPKGADQAIVTFVVGEVKLERQGESPRQLKHREILKKDDVITTAKNSFFAFQIGEESLIRMPSDAKLKLTEILDQDKNRFFLEKGSVFAKVKKLRKGSSYEVYTNTMTAAIRGTEFSVRYENDKAVVAVREGSVKVQKVNENLKLVDEKDVDGGSAVEISKDTSIVRPIAKDEQQEFLKIQKVVIINNIHEKSESDLIKNEKKVFENSSDEPPSLDVKKDISIKLDDSTSGDVSPSVKINDSSSKEAGPIVKEDPENRVELWPSKNVFKSSETIVVNYKNMPESKYCWISVAKTGASGKQFASYDWTHSRKNGQMIFEGLNLEPGTYEARAHFNRGHNVDKRIIFKIE